MQIKINQIPDEGLALELPVTAAWLDSQCPDLGVRPSAAGVVLRGRLQKTGQDYLLRAAISGALEIPCSRCLEPATLPLDLPLTVTFVEGEEEPSADEAEHEAEADEPDVVFFTGAEIDLAPEVRDEIVLAVPMNIHCREDCRGLCPVCGGNRNERPCDCEEKQQRQTSPFAALGKLRP